MKDAKSAIPIKDLVRTFLMPMIVGKALILYFGANYSKFPGEGYGYGLLFSILFTLATVSRFVF